MKPLLNVSSILLHLVGQRLKLGDCLGAVRGKEERERREGKKRGKEERERREGKKRGKEERERREGKKRGKEERERREGKKRGKEERERRGGKKRGKGRESDECVMAPQAETEIALSIVEIHK